MPKICVYCKQDCSNKPRLKDADGHYACQACAEAHGKGSQGSAHGTGSGTAHASRRAAKAPASVAAPATEAALSSTPDAAIGDDAMDLSDLVAASEKAGGSLQALRLCPMCQTSNASHAADCRECGYSFASGRPGPSREADAARRAVKIAGVPAKSKCERCGYSLAGLLTPVCPECGHVNPTNRHAAQHEERTKASARAYWVKPLVIIGVSLPVAAAFQIYAATKAGNTAGSGLAIFGISIAMYVVCSFAVYFLLCLVWFGFSQSLKLACLCLLAVAVSSTAISSVANALIPLPLIPGLVTLFCYCGIAADLLDMDLREAFLFGFLCNVATFAGAIFVVSAIMAYVNG